MTFINHHSKEINIKAVYYGPGLCGKTTNLEYIYKKSRNDSKGKMISLATETERTLFFDFLPISLGEIDGYKTRFHLYTVPGQVYYNSSRKLVLKGVDGIIFVADSQNARFQANLESIENLRENLSEHEIDVNTLPMVLQYNKRDLPNITDIAEMQRSLNFRNVPAFQATAFNGWGVFDTLKALTKLALKDLQTKQLNL